MTLLLTSVAGSDEAESAVAHGADIIDLRGAATPESVRDVLAAVAGRRAVSAGTGEIELETLADTGLDYLKVLTRADESIVVAASSLATRTKLLGIMLVEDGIEVSFIKLMAANGFAGVILNTSAGENLIEALDIATLADFADMVRQQGMMIGFAGALEPPDIPRLLLLEPDILAFRYDPGTIDGLRAQIPQDQRKRARTPAKVDYRLAAPRPSPPDMKELDRIFVHDFVLPVHIGTYARERGEPQNVRFSVDVSIARPSDVPQEMHDVLSYDIITDSIRMISARRHIALSETLAEEIAAAVLAHPRAVTVTVRVEKLDTGSGSVGVEIARGRPAEAATVRQLFGAGESDPKTSS
jgi:(5-formylfuran-3-yl)methyl phosphate synthase